MNADCFSSSKKRQGRRRRWKSWFSGKRGDKREDEENLAREQVGQCSCSLVWCVFVSCGDVLGVIKCILSMYVYVRL